MSYDNFPIAVVDNGGQWTHREYRVLNYLGCRAEIISNVTSFLYGKYESIFLDDLISKCFMAAFCISILAL